MKVLVVDDEAQIRRFLNVSLSAQGYELFEAGDCQEAIRQFTTMSPDAVILDLGLPDGDGLDVVKTIRSIASTPIIVLSARHDENQKVLALDAGANDYVTKPFGMPELLARLRRLIRDMSDVEAQFAGSTLTNGPIRIDVTSRSVYVHDKYVRLTKKEFDILVMLTRHAGKVLTHQQILGECWGPAYVEEKQYLRIYIKNLRDKIGDSGTDPELLLTEPGVGYRLVAAPAGSSDTTAPDAETA
ncbi:MAG: response regulator transcription factor [Alphaproteobacteria bacterium]|jgi:two-component system KDP operon response regulator KdpE|uniref:response regulator n=1 Tax=Pacificispira sp. TaxID=2888761 RepID=UPI001B1B12C7|nr:response regulator transcription factor [Alphaproteobacteria bacterium]MBO6862461.1 response regulator transcription factor [Alphaproteobacteria bacterium]